MFAMGAFQVEGRELEAIRNRRPLVLFYLLIYFANSSKKQPIWFQIKYTGVAKLV